MSRIDRRVVVAITLVAGTASLGFGLHARGDTAGFYAGTVVAAVVWAAGGLAAGGVRWRRSPAAVGEARQFGVAVGVGIGLYALLVVLDLVVREIAFLSDALDRILADADRGPVVAVLVVTLVSAVAEEVFFRGALYDTVDRRAGDRAALVATIAIYAAVTAVSANLVLIAAALLVGAVTTWERRSTGAIGASVVTHVVWSALMVTAFPR